MESPYSPQSRSMTPETPESLSDWEGDKEGSVLAQVSTTQYPEPGKYSSLKTPMPVSTESLIDGYLGVVIDQTRLQSLPSSGNHRLVDYQLQLKLLEEQNMRRKRLAKTATVAPGRPSGVEAGDNIRQPIVIEEQTSITEDQPHHSLAGYQAQMKTLEDINEKIRARQRGKESEITSSVPQTLFRAEFGKHDYQMQLLLHEQQKKKRDMMMRQEAETFSPSEWRQRAVKENSYSKHPSTEEKQLEQQSEERVEAKTILAAIQHNDTISVQPTERQENTTSSSATPQAKLGESMLEQAKPKLQLKGKGLPKNMSPHGFTGTEEDTNQDFDFDAFLHEPDTPYHTQDTQHVAWKARKIIRDQSTVLEKRQASMYQQVKDQRPRYQQTPQQRPQGYLAQSDDSRSKQHCFPYTENLSAHLRLPRISPAQLNNLGQSDYHRLTGSFEPHIRSYTSATTVLDEDLTHYSGAKRHLILDKSSSDSVSKKPRAELTSDSEASEIEKPESTSSPAAKEDFGSEFPSTSSTAKIVHVHVPSASYPRPNKATAPLAIPKSSYPCENSRRFKRNFRARENMSSSYNSLPKLADAPVNTPSLFNFDTSDFHDDESSVQAEILPASPINEHSSPAPSEEITRPSPAGSSATLDDDNMNIATSTPLDELEVESEADLDKENTMLETEYPAEAGIAITTTTSKDGATTTVMRLGKGTMKVLSRYGKVRQGVEIVTKTVVCQGVVTTRTSTSLVPMLAGRDEVEDGEIEEDVEGGAELVDD